MKTCPTCKREFDDSEGFCKFDGTQLIMKVEASVTGKKCPKCGKTYGEDDGFCSICGVKLIALVEDENKCPNCGAEMPEGAVFCSKCGARADLYAGHGGGSGEETSEALVEKQVEENVEVSSKLDLQNLSQYSIDKLLADEAQSHNGLVQMEIGDRYFYGTGVDVNNCKAYEFYKLAAKQDYLWAKNQIGVCYLYGYHVQENNQKAFDIFKKICDSNDFKSSEDRLAECYLNGWGTSVDEKKAFNLFKKAADKGNGNIHAIGRLGWCYLFSHGTQENNSAGYQNVKIAAEAGDYNSMYFLAKCYDNGWGCDVHMDKAIKWYKKAADLGHEEAKKRLQEIEDGVDDDDDDDGLVKRYGDSSDISIENPCNWESQDGWTNVNVKIHRIHNDSPWTTGTLEICFWYAKNQYHGGSLDGYLMGEDVLEELEEGYYFKEVSRTFKRTGNPPTGDYYSIITVNEYHESGNWYIRAWVNFDGKLHWNHK